MKKLNLLITCSFLLLLILAACAPQATPTADPAMISTIVAQNILLTQSAATMTALVAQQSATPAATNTPNASPTPYLTPTETVTPTPLEGVWLLFDNDTNCRAGPATYYTRVALVEAGNNIQALAMSQDENFYYIRFFDTSNHYCWVTKDTVYVTGNKYTLTKFTAQPTNTPAPQPTVEAGFTVAYSSLQNCTLGYFLNFTIKNIGNTPWQSVKITMTDNTNNTTTVFASDSFVGYTGCTETQSQNDLSLNEPGLVSTYNAAGVFAYDPTGHSLGITVSLFSEKGLKGTTISKSLSVTP